MKIFSHYGLNDFVVCLGYKGYSIKEYFNHYFLHNCDITFDVRTMGMEIHQNAAEQWRVTLVDTGLNTMTGGRLKRVRSYLGEETFLMTYGDGLGDVDIGALLAFHRQHGRLATVTAVRSPGRFGVLSLADDDRVTSFKEKAEGDHARINGGFFVLEPQTVEYIQGDETSFEKAPLEALASEGELAAYKHDGFWHAMDTLRDKNYLDELWVSGKAPWKVW